MNIKKNETTTEESMIEKLNDLSNVELFSTLSLATMNEFYKRFKNFFGENGFHEIPPLWYIPDKHDSLLFTNSVIVSLLEKIQNEEIIEDKYFIKQPCLRTQNLNDDLDSYPSYMSGFTMAWCIDHFSNYDNFCTMVIDFLLSFFDISNIKIAITKSQVDHLNFWGKQQFELMDHPNNYYDWQFGKNNIDWSVDDIMSETNAKWISIMLKMEEEFIEIGNILIVYIDKKPSYVGFWFWLETLMSILSKKKKHQVEFTNLPHTLFEEISYNSANALHVRLIDTINILKILYTLDIKSSPRGRWWIIRKALKLFYTLTESLYFDNEKKEDLLKYVNNNNIKQDFQKYWLPK